MGSIFYTKITHQSTGTLGKITQMEDTEIDLSKSKSRRELHKVHAVIFTWQKSPHGFKRRGEI